MVWQDQLNGDSLTWLLEPDPPGVRYLALRHLVGCAPDDPELVAARVDAYTRGPIAAILDQMDQSGYWSKPGPGYGPKYYSTVWALITLAQLGASAKQDERVNRACEYLMDHALTAIGQFTSTGAPSGTVDCLQGNLCAALLDLGYDDERLAAAFEWMARSVTGDGVAPKEDQKALIRYFAGKSGPSFACGANSGLACGWGAVKVLLAFSKLPCERRTPLVERAIQQGVAFLFSVDPADATYPTGGSDKPSGNWWKFGFPVFYVTDVLQTAEALTGLGYGADPRLSNTLKFIRSKQDDQGRWSQEYSYTGKTWIDFGDKRQPNKWVTYRALCVLKAVV